MTQLISGRQYTLKKSKLQNNRIRQNEYFLKIIEELRENKINKKKVLSLILTLVSNSNGQLFTRIIQNLHLENESYDTIAQITGVTKEQARNWIEEWYPELFEKKTRKAGDIRA